MGIKDIVGRASLITALLASPSTLIYAQPGTVDVTPDKCFLSDGINPGKEVPCDYPVQGWEQCQNPDEDMVPILSDIVEAAFNIARNTTCNDTSTTITEEKLQTTLNLVSKLLRMLADNIDKVKNQ